MDEDTINSLTRDLKKSLHPRHHVYYSTDYYNEEERQANMRKNPASIMVRVDVVDGAKEAGRTFWKEEDKR